MARSDQSTFELVRADLRDAHPEHPARFLALDITDPAACLAACDGMDGVLHLAADPSPDADFRTTVLPLNMVGTYNVVEAALAAGVGRVAVRRAARRRSTATRSTTRSGRATRRVRPTTTASARPSARRSARPQPSALPRRSSRCGSDISMSDRRRPTPPCATAWLGSALVTRCKCSAWRSPHRSKAMRSSTRRQTMQSSGSRWSTPDGSSDTGRSMTHSRSTLSDERSDRLTNGSWPPGLRFPRRGRRAGTDLSGSSAPASAGRRSAERPGSPVQPASGSSPEGCSVHQAPR